MFYSLENLQNLNIKGSYYIIFITIFFISVGELYSQAPKNLFVAKRTTIAPDIDGFLGDEAWELSETDSVAIQYTPYNKKKATSRTIFQVLYDDKALYVAATLFDHPDSILTGLGRRDDAFEMNADQFIVEIGPYNDGINSFSFMVSSSGVQSDYQNYYNTKDYTWDAVWKSKTRILERGWIVEMKIPYSAIRFSKNIFQVWSLNVYRLIKRKEELASWNFVDRDIDGMTNQAGELIGIENIRAPLRLSVTPYLTTYLEKIPEKKWNAYLKGGLDLKYGINQSFTLEASVLPDFGQVEYDDKVLNISPYETKYPEKRHFFSNPAEMFSKADIFYSRRVGLSVDEKLLHDSLRPNEIFGNELEKHEIINAVKISGRTSKRLGLGIVNAMTKPSLISYIDTINGTSREYTAQSFTNYNVIAIDKTLQNNSLISIINTNFLNDKFDYISNVTGTEFKFSNRANSYAISGKAALSQIFDTINGVELGFKTAFYFDKTSGKFQFRLGNEIISEKYNQNDMGYLPYVNEISTFTRLNYNIYEPFWEILSWKSSIEFRYGSLYKPQSFIDFKIIPHTELLFSNHFSVSLGGFWRPHGNHDYYEARRPGWNFKKAESYSGFIKLRTDSRRMLNANIMYKYWSNVTTLGMKWHTVGISPNLRIQSRFQVGLNLFYDKFANSIGHTYTINDTIYMGKRHLETFSNTLTLLYSFTDKAWVNLKVRHYYSTARYDKYYTLNNRGKLDGADIYPHSANTSYHRLNLDFSVKWEFAPGSQLSFVWKNLYNNRSNIIKENYFDITGDLLSSSFYNNFSIKFLYYLDFMYLKGNGN